jgi:alanine dehydrogenase
MVLLLTERDVDSLIDMKLAISCLENAFREQSMSRVLQPERQVIQLKDSNAVVRIMAAFAPQIQALGAKAILGVPAKRQMGRSYFVTLLFDPDDASLLAIIPAGRLTQLRTGAASGVATKYLARSESSKIGILGAGVQGYGQFEGVSSVIPLSGGNVFDFHDEKIERFIERAERQAGVRLEKASKLEELYSNDIICTATTASVPVIFGQSLRPGIHVNAVGSNAANRQEIHESVLLKGRVFVDRIGQALTEAGDFVVPIKQGLYDSNLIAGELCDVVTGKIKGRSSNDEITVFKSVGIAVEDVAVAKAVYDLALEKGMGQDVKLSG